MPQIDLSLIISCYNEELILESSVHQIFEVLDNSRFSYEIIFVDDCSRDGTKMIIENIIRENPNRKIKRIFHETNKGRGRSVSDGIRISEGEVAGFIDIDLEVHARYILSCVLAVKSGWDVTTAHRVYKFQLGSISRHIMSRGYAFLVRELLGVRLKDTETGFKFFDRGRILAILNEIKEGGWFWDTEVMVRTYLRGYKIKEIPCLYLRNIDKASTVSGISDSIYYFKKLLNFRRELRTQSADKSTKDYWLKTPHRFLRSYNQGGSVLVRKFLRDRFTRISGLMDVNKGTTAIDVGCGTGVYVKLLLEKGAEVTGVDFSDRMLDACDKELRGFWGKGYTLINCEADSLKVPDNKFDLLLSVGVLDYISDVGGVLKEFCRVVKNGEKIVFTVPKRPSPFFLLRGRLGNYIKKKTFGLPPIITALSKTQIEYLLMNAGLVLIDMKSFYRTMWIVQCKKQVF